MKYFTLAELYASDTARVKGIDNTPPATIAENLTALGEQVLDKIREAHGQPIRINCGYRSPALNAAVKGVASSQHLKGEAADIANSLALQKKILEMIKAKTLIFDQLIIEKPNRDGVGAWLHISYSKVRNRQQVLIFDGKSYKPYKP